MPLAGLTLTASAHGAYPNSIASTGDSITRAFNDCWFPYVDCPSASWSTGTSSYSHYRRIQGANPAIAGRTYNHAVTGADMADLYGQVQGVIGRRAEYVTILMGANDVCASSEARHDARRDVPRPVRAGAGIARREPAELPGLRLEHPRHPPALLALPVRPGRELGLGDRRDLPVDARAAVLEPARPTSPGAPASASGTSTTTRSWRRSARSYTQCRFDANAVFNTPFVRTDVTTRDYFHPSVNGQTKLAAVTWSQVAAFVQ